MCSRIPLALSTTALTCAFNYKLSDWASNVSRDTSESVRRAGELRRTGYLLGLGLLSMAPELIGGLATGAAPFKFRPSEQMALLGLAWGGCLTIVTGVFQEWDHYNDGTKVIITGGSLLGLLAGAILVK